MFEKGKLYNRRRDIHGRFKGQPQGGISTPREHPLIFLFTGRRGEPYGYRDGYGPKGSFWYTGEGQVGDMEFKRGNRAIRDHAANGKRIYLFKEAGKGIRFVSEVRYVGHRIEQRPDRNDKQRKAIVFELELLPG